MIQYVGARGESRHQTPKGKPVLKSETPLQIIRVGPDSGDFHHMLHTYQQEFSKKGYDWFAANNKAIFEVFILIWISTCNIFQ